MNVLLQSFPVMRMQTVSTQWAAMSVSATVATLEMAMSAMVRWCCTGHKYMNVDSPHADWRCMLVVLIITMLLYIIALM